MADSNRRIAFKHFARVAERARKIVDTDTLENACEVVDAIQDACPHATSHTIRANWPGAARDPAGVRQTIRPGDYVTICTECNRLLRVERGGAP